MILVATCMFGLERQLGEEIDALGLKRVHTMDGRVTFEGAPADIARANMFLRCAERVMIKVGEFPAATYDELFEGVKALPWEQYIGSSDAFPVKGHCIKSKLFSIPDCQSIIKKAVVEKDPTEQGDRALLNFGHTIGHAIEKAKNFELSHGECISLGAVAAAYISWKRNLLTMEEYYGLTSKY